MNGKEINLTGDDVVIKSNNFNVDKNGNMTCTNANISGSVTSNDVNITGGKISLVTNPYRGEDLISIEHESQDFKTYFSHRNGYIGTSKGSPHSGGLYLQGGTDQNEICVIAGNTEIFGTGIRTPSLTQTSLEEQKKNFEKLENALDIIKNVDIYKYNLKSEEDGTKKHIGFVIGDNYKYSEELTSKENDGADIYSLASCCLKAIKEQQEIIENLQNEIKELKESRN